MSYRADDLLANYRRMADGELLELASEKEQLTPEARTALETELANRGLADEPPENESDESHESPERHGNPSPASEEYRSVLFGSSLPDRPSNELVVVFSAENEGDAQAAQAALGAAGIESQLQIVVLVKADQAEDALEIIASSDADDDEEAD